MRRIGGLDGLRAFACLAVVCHHLNLPLLRGGYLGVDVFFVLSGFLITGLLVNEQEGRGRLDLPAFYARRAGRLYPALIVLVVAFLPFASWLAEPGHSYPLTSALALTYTTDLWIWVTHESGGAFNHTWSLAVEEQFYLLWPVVLIVLRRRRAILAATVLLGLASLVAMFLLPGTTMGEPLGYFLPHTRAWELLAGAVVALAADGIGEGLAVAGSWVGTAGIAAALLFANRLQNVPAEATTAMVTLAAVVAVLSTCLLVIGCRHQGFVSRLLSLPPLTWLGQRTYGLYLFHVPIWMCLMHVTGNRVLLSVLVPTLGIAAAALSFRFVEQPIGRRAHAFSKRRLDAASRAGDDRLALPAPRT